MKIQFANKHQVTIANLFWEAQDQKQVKFLLKTFGVQGEIVYNMIIAETMDGVNDTDIAERVLSKYRR